MFLNTFVPLQPAVPLGPGGPSCPGRPWENGTQTGSNVTPCRYGHIETGVIDSSEESQMLLNAGRFTRYKLQSYQQICWQRDVEFKCWKTHRNSWGSWESGQSWRSLRKRRDMFISKRLNITVLTYLKHIGNVAVIHFVMSE